MKREKNKVISLFAITLFCLLLGFNVGAFIFGLLTLVKGLRYWQDPDRLLKDRILEDAKRWEVEIPNSYVIRKSLFNLYRRVRRVEMREAIFISSFSVILDEFWQQAGSYENESEWLENLRFLDRNIPKAKLNKNNLTDALSEMQSLNLHLEKATIEVRR